MLNSCPMGYNAYGESHVLLVDNLGYQRVTPNIIDFLIFLIYIQYFKFEYFYRESLRVGDHNTAMARDCDDLGCIDPYERFGVVERVVHEAYRQTKKGRIFNDIALLKTDRNIKYSFSVAPICLPNVLESLPPLVTGARLTVAGWGNNGTGKFNDLPTLNRHD